MNEPPVNALPNTKESNKFLYKRTVATDRFGTRMAPTSMRSESDHLPCAGLSTRPKQVFLLEDSDDDAEIFLRVAQRSCYDITIARATTVSQARRLLWDATPDLITLDCHLPCEGGLNLLRDIRCHHRLRYVPVVMFSGTEDDEDVNAAYLLGANSFLKKPSLSEDYFDSVGLLLAYWLEKNYSSTSRRAKPIL